MTRLIDWWYASRRLNRLSEWWHFYAKYDAMVIGVVVFALAYFVVLILVAS